MIAVDTSALMAIVLNEPEAEACIAALEAEDHLPDLSRHGGRGTDRRRPPTWETRWRA